MFGLQLGDGCLVYIRNGHCVYIPTGEACSRGRELRGKEGGDGGGGEGGGEG